MELNKGFLVKVAFIKARRTGKVPFAFEERMAQHNK